MSFQALEWARKLPIPPTPKFLMMVIASYTDTDDACFPALTTLADDTRQSVDSVRRQVTRLQGAGLLKRYPRWQTGKDAFAIGQPGEDCPRGCRRTSDKIQLLLKADLGAAETYFDPDKAPDLAAPPVADCEGDGSKNGGDSATAPVAPCVLPQEDSLEPKDERETHAREEKRQPVRRFLLKWPTAAVDDKTKITRAWDLLPDDEYEPALDGIDGFIAELKAHGRKHVPAGWKYLEERSWKLLKKPEQRGPSQVVFACWSREWWALLIKRIRSGDRPTFMVKYATEPGKREWGAPAADMPPADEIAAFKSYPSDGPEMAAWRPWFERKGARLPEWRDRIWVHLPSAEPPDSNSTGPPLSNTDIESMEEFK